MEVCALVVLSLLLRTVDMSSGSDSRCLASLRENYAINTKLTKEFIYSLNPN